MKVLCDVCKQTGYLTIEKRGNNKYTYVAHFIKEGEKLRKKKHYLGKDTEALKNEIERFIDNNGLKKLLHYPGGDYFIADELLKRLNAACSGECTFVEVFGGSGYMSQAVDRKRFKLIVYNDINDKLTMLYRMVKKEPEKMATLLSLLPLARSYHKIVIELLKENRCLGELEIAALLFYGICSSFFGSINKGFSVHKYPSRNLAKSYHKHARGILDMAEKWKDITIENLDFRDVIKMYDRETTVFYLDPPFVGRSEDYYGVDFSVDDLRDMATMLTQIKGKFLLKVDDKTYAFIEDILGKYKVEKIEQTLTMDKRVGEERKKWVLVLISNIKQRTLSEVW